MIIEEIEECIEKESSSIKIRFDAVNSKEDDVDSSTSNNTKINNQSLRNMSDEASATWQNFEEITLNELDPFISAFVANEKTDLCEINKLSLTIRTKLVFMC